MSHLPFYKRYPRDLVEGTVGMSFEEKTAYAFVLDLIYMYGGKLPDDSRYISGQLNCSVRKWKNIRERLIELNKLQVENDLITNYRAVIELESLRKYQDKQSQNRSKPNKNKDVKSPRTNHTETDTDVETSLRSVSGRASAKNDVEILDKDNNVIPLKASQPKQREPDNKFAMSLDWIPPVECSQMAKTELQMNKDQYCDARGDFVEYWANQSRTKKGKKSADGWKRAFNSSLRRCAAAWRTNANYTNTSRKTGGVVENMRAEIQRGGVTSDWF